MFKEDKEYLENRGGANRPFMTLFRKGVYMSIVREFDKKIKEKEDDLQAIQTLLMTYMTKGKRGELKNLQLLD